MGIDFKNENISDIDFCEKNYTIHLDLSEGENPFLDDGYEFNINYLKIVHKNAIKIFEDLFFDSGSIDIVHLNYLYDNKFRKTRFSDKYTVLDKDITPKLKCYKNYEDIVIYEFNYNDINLSDIKYKKLLKSICNQDFKGKYPTINQRENYSSIYFLEASHKFLYHLYDDRGLWLYFENEETYSHFKEKYNNLLLNICDEN
ncbi:DUF3885 domain-containing protein [Staphylococcus hyicus]|uniref:DUF3885 domain-containing protein n=1 Tax=Staphylococcus hyicus TaxID=1284 RepID=UPI00211C5A4D|nr:DUF3885 domain-containing protein [Staphylococcus hyicus]MCQ9301393.1 DUF3885 domain-containing protein [Staphylococcus hyicus]MDP4448323.1 DUF3885 domain-containing protein [Staphylococcus hyicus]MDP4459761.1 DUF3885 domain-containing protein [Staphylococcus hyicus]MDP4468676.1 DUF3885 domain-containing protein [Staphylococcus hyicus]